MFCFFIVNMDISLVVIAFWTEKVMYCSPPPLLYSNMFMSGTKNTLKSFLQCTTNAPFIFSKTYNSKCLFNNSNLQWILEKQ